MRYENVSLNPSDSSRYALYAARFSVASVSVLIFLKMYAYAMSGSASLLGTLVDSAADAVISVMLLMAIRFSAKPADEDHRYGHGKIEGVAALFQAAFLGGGAVFLAFESLQRFVHPVPVTHHMLAIGVSALALALSLAVVLVQQWVLRRTASLALSADQSHYKSDILLNGGVIGAVLVNWYGGPLWVDTVFGLVIAGYIARTAYQVGREATDMLMDRELPDEIRYRIIAIAEAHTGVLGLHDLRTRRMGNDVHISFDIEVNPDLPLRDAHEISRDLEGDILREIPNADIIIHIDPQGDIYDARHRVQGIHH